MSTQNFKFLAYIVPQRTLSQADRQRGETTWLDDQNPKKTLTFT